MKSIKQHLVPLLVPLLALNSQAWPQSSPDPVPYCPDVIVAYVDPTTGCDPIDPITGQADPSGSTAQSMLNSSTPFQTIQAAIDSVQWGLVFLTASGGHPDAQGLVRCMPGTYGPTGGQGRTDVLPIFMRDRVHLQGSGARGTVIRGDYGPTENVFWPDDTCCGQRSDKSVLLDFSFEGQFSGVMGLPWSTWSDNTEEMVDGFTFEGGHVQVLHATEGDGLGRVSNCVFDLRAEEGEPTTGPEIGIMTNPVYDFPNG